MVDLEALSSYDFELPKELIAQYPVQPRDTSRLLLVDRAKKTISHHSFGEFPNFFSRDDLLVANNSKVIRARLLGHRIRDGENGGKIEFFLLKKLGPNHWEGLFHAAAKHRPGIRFEIPSQVGGSPLNGELVRGASDSSSGTVEAKFDRDPLADGLGSVPLPPYIATGEQSGTEKSYQTIYAKTSGSSAAPTAGLHFSEKILDELKNKQVDWAEITLHVGLGTFRPVKTNRVSEHKMHAEEFEISVDLEKKVQQARLLKRKITAVGTTSLRAIEAAYQPQLASLKLGWQSTKLFIYPRSGEARSQFQLVDQLLTNFHLPKSSLLMLVSAFGGYDLVRQAYLEAIALRYRFFSYGDAMLIV